MMKSWMFSGRLWIIVFILFFSSSLIVVAEEPNAILYQDEIYVSLEALLAPEILDGTWEFSRWARDVIVGIGEDRLRFANGGDRLIGISGEERILEHPLLVIQGKHYFPAGECATAFNYQLRLEPHPVLQLGQKQLVLNPVEIDSPYQGHQVTQLQPVHIPVRVMQPLKGFLSLHPNSEPIRIPLKTCLLARRELLLKGKPYYLVADCGSSLTSYLISKQDFIERTEPGNQGSTAFSKIMRWQRKEAKYDRSLRHGPRLQCRRTVALTADLCWSLREFEKAFFEDLPQMAARRGGDISIVPFVSGRWLDQHPTEMHRLIELSQAPGVHFIWGLHSWAHPKSGGFMNDFQPDSLREDTLRLEKGLLEWGIVPSVYYRFPGLIHDRERLETILGMDLLSVDCDSWMVGAHMRKPPSWFPPRSGSILLIHGNGNEPGGLPKLYDWLNAHPYWKLGPLSLFLQRP